MSGVQTLTRDGLILHFEAAEAGGRYLAPILILPGLFHSEACWRGMTSMLAHRGWNVYLLPRPEGGGWRQAIDSAARAATELGEQVIVFGSDIGASLALAASPRVRPLALALFAPATPEHVGIAYKQQLGWIARRRTAKGATAVSPPSSVAKALRRASDVAEESAELVADLVDGVGFERPGEHPPAIVFAPDGDPLVSSEHALEFAGTPYARAARTRLRGRWWPSDGWEPVTDDVHRFLILTLADRVVEFPEEIIG